MLAQLARFAVAPSYSIHGEDTFGRGTSSWRLALVAPPGLFRDGFAHLIATCVADIRLECCNNVEDVVPGATRLGLLTFTPGTCSREALSARIEALRARCGGAPIGVVIPDDRTPDAAGLGALGVAGVVSLSSGMEIAVAAVHLMLVGGYCLPPETSPAAARPILRPDVEETATEPLPAEASAADEPASVRDNLTAREHDVLRSLRVGHQNKIIAYELSISESTVKVHLRNILKKLKASNRTQVALGAPLPLERNGSRAHVPIERGDDAEPARAAALLPPPVVGALTRLPV